MLNVGSKVQVSCGYSLRFGGYKGTVAGIDEESASPVGVKFEGMDTIYYFSVFELILEEGECPDKVVDY